MGAEYSDSMNASDTTMWRIERDPALRTTIVGVTVLDAVPDWHLLRSRLLAVADEVPRLRQVVVEPPLGIGSPRWAHDRDFDIDVHLRRVVVDGEADTAAVLDVAAPIAMAAFDRSRPLWEFTLVEGRTGEQAALVQKIHHSVTDGVGAIRMSHHLFDHDDDAAAHVRSGRHAATPSDDHAHEGVRLVMDTVIDQTRGALHVAEQVATGLPGAVAGVARHPRRAAEQTVRTVGSVARLVRPVREPLSPVLRGRGLGRRLAGMDFSLSDLKTAAHVVDGTLNDAFLAALAGGMRRYHAHHGDVPPALRVTMPVNQRRSDDPAGSNKFAPVRFELAIAEPDPRERMRRLGAAARAERREPGLRFTGQVAGALNAVPAPITTAVMGSMLKAVDLVATNVPGLTRPVALVGAPVSLQYAFAPPSGAAFSAGLLSYLDACTLGLVMDTAAVRDPDVLARCVAEGFAEVLAVGGRRRRRR